MFGKPHFQTHDLITHKAAPNTLLRIRRVHTKFFFFHSYSLSVISLKSFEIPSTEIHLPYDYPQSKLTLATYSEMVRAYSLIMEGFSKSTTRQGRTWTPIENNLLKTVYPIIEHASVSDKDYLADLSNIFRRSIHAIQIQYSKLNQTKKEESK